MDITKKYVPCLILSVLLVFSLIGFTATFTMNFFVLSGGSYISASDDNDVPRKAHDEIEKYFTHSHDYSGIPADVYMSALPVDTVKEIIDGKVYNVITNYIKNSDPQFNSLSDYDYAPLKKSITDYFNDFAKKNNVKVDSEYKAQLQNTIDTAISEIESFTDVYMFKEMSKTSLLKKAQDIYPDLTPATYALGALSLLLILIIMAVCLKRAGLGCYWTGVAAMCASVIMLLPTLWIKLSGFTDRPIVSNESIYSAITGFISKMLMRLMIFECGLFAFGLFMMLIYAVSSAKRRKKAAASVNDDDDDDDSDNDNPVFQAAETTKDSSTDTKAAEDDNTTVSAEEE